MFGGSVEDWLKNILYQFLEGQTQIDMPRGVTLSLALNDPKEVVLHSNSNTTSEYAPQLEKSYRFRMQNNQWKIILDQLWTESPIVFRDNSITLEI